jgi:hypothetical protein
MMKETAERGEETTRREGGERSQSERGQAREGDERSRRSDAIEE